MEAEGPSYDRVFGISYYALFSICLGRSKYLVKNLMKENFRTLNTTTTSLLRYIHHVPEHILPFLASHDFFCTQEFTLIHSGKTLGPSLESLKGMCYLYQTSSSLHTFSFLDGMESSRTAFLALKHILKERMGANRRNFVIKRIKSNTALALFLISETDDNLVEQSFLDNGASGILSLLDDFKN